MAWRRSREGRCYGAEVGGGAGHVLRTHRDVRVPSTDRLVVPAVWRALDGCARGGRPTFAENLRQANRAADRFEPSPAIAPFAIYLRRVNDENDLEVRRAGGSHGRFPIGSGKGMGGERLGLENGRGVENPAGGVARLGDVPHAGEVVRQTILRETYQVRHLLSRGAIIDLAG